MIAKALARKGNALVKLGQLEDAIVAYNKSLTEHRTADTLKKLNDTEKALKVRGTTLVRGCFKRFVGQHFFIHPQC